MLECIGIHETEYTEEPVINREIRYTCCDVVQEGADHMLTCWGCGKVFDIYNVVNEEEPDFSGGPLGGRSQYSPLVKKRIYKRLTHFKEHVRRFLGARFTVISPEIINEISKEIPNLKDRQCYNKVKGVLKRLKRPKLYKEIFTIIYQLGGVKPTLKNVDNIYQLYRNFDYYYALKVRDGQIKRRNGISFYMMLDLFLKEMGHESYYEIPYLKDLELRSQVLEIFTQIKKDVNKV